MNNYEKLLDEATKDGLYIIEEASFESSSEGLINGKVIGLNRKLKTTAEKVCILAEELGHHHTTVGNIIDLNNPQNRKQERQARLWAYNKQIGLTGLIRAYENGCQNRHEVAEYLEVTEGFLLEAIECYRDKYGVGTIVDNYYIMFIPNLQIMKLI